MLPITKERLAAVYEMLRSWPPFSRWKLPHSSEVKFHVIRSKTDFGRWWIDGDRHHVEISEKLHGAMLGLVMTMAHEMIHMRQRIARTETRAEHNAEFHRLAKRVCAIHGFDYGPFMG